MGTRAEPPAATMRDRQAPSWRQVFGNGTVLAVVIVLHLVLLAALLRPLAPWSSPVSMAVTDARRALHVRLIAAPPRRQALRPVANVSVPERPPASPARPPEHAAPATEASPSAAPLNLQMPSAAATSAQGYVAGGGFQLPAATPAIRLPGAPRAHAPTFHMIDPKLRGFGGVVHLIGALAGAEDPACLDVQVWKTMSVETLLEHHVTPAQVARTADEHHCAEPRHGLVIRW